MLQSLFVCSVEWSKGTPESVMVVELRPIFSTTASGNAHAYQVRLTDQEELKILVDVAIRMEKVSMVGKREVANLISRY